MKIELGDEVVVCFSLFLAFVMILMFVGKPDLLDGIIHQLMEKE